MIKPSWVFLFFSWLFFVLEVWIWPSWSLFRDMSSLFKKVIFHYYAYSFVNSALVLASNWNKWRRVENFCPSRRQSNTFKWIQIKNACTDCSSILASCAQTFIQVCLQHFSLSALFIVLLASSPSFSQLCSRTSFCFNGWLGANKPSGFGWKGKSNFVQCQCRQNLRFIAFML